MASPSLSPSRTAAAANSDLQLARSTTPNGEHGAKSQRSDFDSSETVGRSSLSSSSSSSNTPSSPSPAPSFNTSVESQPGTANSANSPPSAARKTGGILDSISGLSKMNPLFSAGVGLMSVGVGIAAARQLVLQGLVHGRRLLLTTLEIPSRDKSHAWVLQWITSRGSQSTQHLSVQTHFVQRENGSVSTKFDLVPGPGTHFFRFRGAWIQVQRQRERNMVDLSSGAPFETVTLTTLSRDRKVFAAILEEAKTMALAQEVGKTVVYTAWGPDWRPFGFPRRRRPLESVILDEGISELILSDVKRFIANGSWYMDRGIPYRRGYLLYGPPGSGKSSYIQALAGELEYNICVLNLSERGLTDDRLNHLLSVAPQRSIILLEDVDAAFSKREKVEEKGFSGSLVTFSGLLNALDGVASSEERILFMTTNHIERLDPALLRPGRVDLKVYLGLASPFQIRMMFLRFYQGKADNNLLETFVKAVGDGRVSTAQLQGHFVRFQDQPELALESISSLLTTSISTVKSS